MRHPGGITRLVDARDRWLTGGWDGCVRAWPGGAVVAEVEGPVTGLAWSGAAVDARCEPVTALAARGALTLVTEDLDRVRLLDGDAIRWETKTYKWAYGAAFSPDGATVAAWTWDGELYRWRVADGEREEGLVVGLGMPFLDGAWLDARRVALVGPHRDGGFVGVWDCVARAVVVRALLPSTVYAVVADGERLWLGTDDGVWCWDLAAPEVVRVYDLADHAVDAPFERMFPASAEYDAVGSSVSVVGLARRGDRLAVATAGGVVVERAAGAGALAGATGRRVAARWPEPLDLATWSRSPIPRTGHAGGVTFRLQVPEAVRDGFSDHGYVAHTDGWAVTVAVHAFPAHSWSTELAAARSLASGATVDEALPGGHLLAQPGSASRYLLAGRVFLRCSASGPEPTDALVAICRSLEVDSAP